MNGAGAAEQRAGEHRRVQRRDARRSAAERGEASHGLPTPCAAARLQRRSTCLGHRLGALGAARRAGVRRGAADRSSERRGGP